MSDIPPAKGFYNEIYQDDVEVHTTEEMEAFAQQCGPTQYHEPSSCNKCSGYNKLTALSFASEGCIEEYSTVCEDCGFEDMWCYGFFESSSEIGVNCEIYSFDWDKGGP